MNQTLGVVTSLTVKVVLGAFAALSILPWTEEQQAAVVLAIAAIVDLLIYLGVIRFNPAAQPPALPQQTMSGGPLDGDVGYLTPGEVAPGFNRSQDVE